MFDFSVKNDKGEALSLTDNPNYTVYQITGLTPPQVNLNQSINTTQDGAVINSARVGVRNIVIYMTIDGEIESNRINLYKYFPPKRNVTLYFKNETRDVFIEGMVELIECDLFTNRQIAQISIICPKPFFRDVEEFNTYFSDVSAKFEFPFSIAKEGIEFSSISTNVRKTIINSGDVESGIVIELFAAGGTVFRPVIYNVFEKTHIKLNYYMDQGDLIRINTNAGEKAIDLIKDGVVTNLLGYLDMGSTWLTLKSGDNVFTYDCESGGSNLQIAFKSTLLYSGV